MLCHLKPKSSWWKISYDCIIGEKIHVTGGSTLPREPGGARNRSRDVHFFSEHSSNVLHDEAVLERCFFTYCLLWKKKPLCWGCTGLYVGLIRWLRLLPSLSLYRGVVQLVMLVLFLWSCAPRCLARLCS